MRKRNVNKYFLGGVVSALTSSGGSALGGAAGDVLEGMGGGAGVAGAGLKGALSGAALGPVGMLGGAALGVAKGLINKKKMEEMEKIKRNQDNMQAMGDLAKVQASDDQTLAKGGKIKGKGTGKSDSINAELNEGDFIVPAENAEKAMELGQKYLGWKKGQRSSVTNGDTDVKVSNGEVRFTQDEYDHLSDVGINVDKLAPDADPDAEGKLLGGFIKTLSGAGKAVSGAAGKAMDKIGTAGRDLGKYAKENPGTVLGALQTGAGLLQSANNKKTEASIAPIKSEGAVFGSEATKMENAASNAVSDMMAGNKQAASDRMGNYLNVAKQSGGSNAGNVLNNAAKIDQNTADAITKTAADASKLKLGAQESAAKLRGEGANMNVAVNEKNNAVLEDRLNQNKKNAASNIKSGLENIAGEKVQKDLDKRLKDMEAKYGTMSAQMKTTGQLNGASDTATKPAGMVVPPLNPDDKESTRDEATAKKKGGVIRKKNIAKYANK